MLAVWCDDELSICPEIFRPFISRSLPPPKTIFFRVSQSGGIDKTRFFNLLHQLLSLTCSLNSLILLSEIFEQKTNADILTTLCCRSSFVNWCLQERRPFFNIHLVRTNNIKMITMIYANERTSISCWIFTGPLAFRFFPVFFSFFILFSFPWNTVQIARISPNTRHYRRKKRVRLLKDEERISDKFS